MNCYLITYQGRRYATDSDNVLEAETKFIFQCVDKYSEDDFKVIEVKLSSIEKDESVIWF